MKGLILCAGKGTRLHPFSLATPKVLLRVANRPLIHYCIEKLQELHIEEIGIVIHPSHKQQFMSEVGTGDRWGVKIVYIDQDHPRGIADAVKQAESFAGGDAFMLMLGDNLIEQSLHGLREAIQERGDDVSLLLGEVGRPQDYGIAEIVDGRIVGLEEKSPVPKSNLAVLGAYAFSPAIFSAIHAIAPSRRGEYEITDAIQWMIGRGRAVSHCITDGKHFDVGTLERWLEASRWMTERLDGNGEPRADERFEGCSIVGPVVIDPSSELKDCVIGPYVAIGPHVRLEGCRVSNSILLEGTNLKQVDMVNIIGSPEYNCEVKSGEP